MSRRGRSISSVYGRGRATAVERTKAGECFMKRLFAFALALAPFAAFAHHSAVRFDLTIRYNMVSGVVKTWEPANPHTKIVLEITDAKGTRDVEFEGHSRNNYSRAGWREG